MMCRSNRSDQRSVSVVGRRNGALLVVALVCVAVLSLLMLTLVRFVVQAQRQQQHEIRGVQADWLLEAGLARAASQRATRPDYAGEIWEIAGESAGLERPARIEITLPSAGPTAEGTEVTVLVTYPTDTPQTHRRTRTVRLTAPASRAELKE